MLPFPKDTNLFYLFYVNFDYWDSGEFVPSKCRYAVLDKQMNSGNGGVVYYDSLLLQDTLMQGNLSAIKHGNGTDWWLLIRKHRSNKFYKYLIDSNGIHAPLIQYFGVPFNVKHLPADFQGSVSNDGSKIAYIAQGTSDSLFMNRMEIYNFDRCTGNLTHYYYHSDTFNFFYPHDTLSFFGSSISPNGRYFYISNNYILFQFDLQAADIYKSKIKVGRWDGSNDGFSSTLFWEQKLGIDGRIYITTYSGNKYLHVINAPDQAGSNCNFIQKQIYNHASYTQRGLPNTANYALGAIAPCGNVGVNELGIRNDELRISPNPCGDNLKINGPPIGGLKIIEVFDLLGRELEDLKMSRLGNEIQIQVSDLSSGIYFIKTTDDKGFVRTAKFGKE